VLTAMLHRHLAVVTHFPQQPSSIWRRSYAEGVCIRGAFPAPSPVIARRFLGKHVRVDCKTLM
jgi:hypothetical protein